MERNFQPFRVEIGAPSLFWAHMYESDHKIWMGFPDERAWESLNLVATFDSNQVVNLLRIFPDRRLPEEVAKMSQEGLLPAVDFSVPAKLQAERYPMTADERSLGPDQMPVTIVAGQAKLTISATVPGKWIPPRSARGVTVAIPRYQIIDLWIDNGGLDYRLTERTVDAHFRFKPTNEFGSSLAIRLTFADALTLARWMTQAAPGDPKTDLRRRTN
jgi:hypothetical protein